MKRKVEIEIELPECIEPDFLNYLSLLNKEDYIFIKGHVMGSLYKSGKITLEELLTFINNNPSKKD